VIQDILRDYVLFNGADKMVGRIETFTPPSLERMVEDVRMSGMDTSMPVDMGMAAMEASWVTTGVDKTTYAGFGLMNGIRTTVSVRGAVVDAVTGVAKPVIHKMVGDISKIDPAGWKVGERPGLTTTMKLIFYSLSHGGAPVIEIDVINATRLINGVDQLIQLRAMTGR
jgi:hypothetical protein